MRFFAANNQIIVAATQGLLYIVIERGRPTPETGKGNKMKTKTTAMSGRGWSATIRNEKLVLSVETGKEISQYILRKIDSVLGVSIREKYNCVSFNANTVDCPEGFDELIFRV